MTNPKATPETLADIASYIEHEQACGVDISLSDERAERVVSALRSTAPQAAVSHLSLREQFEAGKPDWRLIRITPEREEIIERFGDDRLQAEAAYKAALSAPAERLTGEASAEQLIKVLHTAFRRFGGIPAIARSEAGAEKIISICVNEVMASRLAAPAVTAGTEREARREQFARIIDPGAWQQLARDGSGFMSPERVLESLVKADAILALSAAPAASGADKQERKA